MQKRVLATIIQCMVRLSTASLFTHTGVGLHVHARLASALSVTAAALDGLTVLLNLLIIWGVDCQQDETCRSVMTYVFIFSAYVALHCYLSHSIYKRARSVQAMLNPVSSGLVKL